MERLSFSELDKQKVLVSVSELARNVLVHANGQGFIESKILKDSLCITVVDQGPGILNIEEILRCAEVKSETGLGLGLNGVKRLMDEFYVETGEGGTKIIAVKWRGSSRGVERNRSNARSTSIDRSNFGGYRP
ncbi:ATP-binding protein [Ammoniphilus oxalaticus]|uniref:ATP-binding protein n=1 Tax=Ammoniphilus oxalaticus TaxID=66863 RepID=UPI000E71C128|nr:ATP-binding protein [Ammoniphilus oxalaticus]